MHAIAQFTDESLEATAAYWRGKIGEDDFGGDVEKTLTWASENIDYSNNNSTFAYGIFKEGAQAADAVIEIVYSPTAPKSKRWVKALDMHTAPHLDYSFSDDPPDEEELTSVISATIIGLPRLTKYHPTKTAKLYGRSSLLLSFLRAFAVYFNQTYRDHEHISVQVEGRWLVIRSTDNDL